MVVPSRHVARLADATPDELAELIALTQVAERAHRSVSAAWLNMGLNSRPRVRA